MSEKIIPTDNYSPELEPKVEIQTGLIPTDQSQNEFLGRYVDCTFEELLEANRRVRTGPGWVSARGRCASAIASEFYARGIEHLLEE